MLRSRTLWKYGFKFQMVIPKHMNPEDKVRFEDFLQNYDFSSPIDENWKYRYFSYNHYATDTYVDRIIVGFKRPITEEFQTELKLRFS